MNIILLKTFHSTKRGCTTWSSDSRRKARKKRIKLNKWNEYRDTNGKMDSKLSNSQMVERRKNIIRNTMHAIKFPMLLQILSSGKCWGSYKLANRMDAHTRRNWFGFFILKKCGFHRSTEVRSDKEREKKEQVETPPTMRPLIERKREAVRWKTCARKRARKKLPEILYTLLVVFLSRLVRTWASLVWIKSTVNREKNPHESKRIECNRCWWRRKMCCWPMTVK